MAKLGRKAIADGATKPVTLRIEKSTLRKVESIRERSQFDVTTPSVLRWLIAKGIETAEKEAANA